MRGHVAILRGAGLGPIRPPQSLRRVGQDPQLRASSRTTRRHQTLLRPCLCERRGRKHGHEREDWFQAESERLGSLSAELWTSTVIGHPVALIKRVNNQIARKLLETADLLDRRGGNSFRIRAYREAAQHLIHLSQPIQEIFRERDVAGIRDALQVGDRLAEVVRAAIVTGRMPLLDRLRAAAGPESVLQSVPGLGPVWADRIRHDLGIESLEELEVAAYDGRLEHVAGMGDWRAYVIRSPLGWPEPGRAHRRLTMRRQWLRSSRLTVSMAKPRPPDVCRSSRPGGLTCRAKLGFRCSTRGAANANTRRSIPTPPAPTSWDGPMTGS